MTVHAMSQTTKIVVLTTTFLHDHTSYKVKFIQNFIKKKSPILFEITKESQIGDS